MTTEEIKAAIQSQIRTNGTGAITGAVLQGVLLDVLAGSKVTDLGNFTTDTALDAAVRSEALRVGEGDTGGVPGVKVILGSSSAGDQRNYLYFALSTGSQTRVVRIDPSTGHLQQTQKANRGSDWSEWAELYDTSGGGDASECFDDAELTASATSAALNLTRSGGGAKGVTFTAATEAQAGLMTAGDKSNLDNSVWSIEFGTGVDIVTLALYKNNGGNTSVQMPMASSGQAGIMSAADKVKLDGLTGGGLEDLGTFATWDFLRTSIVGTLPTFPAVAKVGGKQVLLLCDDNVSGGAGTRKVFAYDSGGALYALGCKLSGGRTTWDAAWTVTDLTAGSTGGTGMAIVNASEYNTGSLNLSAGGYVESATEGDIEAADNAAVVWVKRLSYTGQPSGDVTGKGGRFYLRLMTGSAAVYYGSWPAVSATVPGDAYYNQTATTGKAARVGMLFNFVQDGAVRFRSNEADADSLALLATVQTLGS